jgi:hypothetical protein
MADEGQVLGAGHVGGVAAVEVRAREGGVAKFRENGVAGDALALEAEADELSGFLLGTIAPMYVVRLG